MRKFILKQQINAMAKINQAKELLTNKRGDENSSSHMGWTLLVVGLIAVIGGALFLAYKNDLIPDMLKKLKSIGDLK